jgi:integrase
MPNKEFRMPAQKRQKTRYPGVYYIEGKAVGSNKKELIYYIMYRKDGRQVHEKAGRQLQDDMTPARASGLRSERIEGKQLTNKERREAEKAAKAAEEAKWTINRLFEEYMKGRPNNKAQKVDKGRYEKYLKKPFGAKEPKNILPLDVDRLRIRLLKKLSPQTVKHILNLLTWIVNFGVKKNLCEGISFHIKKPTVNNLKTEDLTDTQLKRLLEAIGKNTHAHSGPLMLMALYTGMRRGELFKLKWKDIDFERGFINIVDPKGKSSQKIPLNDAARGVLESHLRTRSQYVFPGRGGRQRTDINKAVNEIKEEAGLPKDFRPLHGLRHVYASLLASSGKVDMYVLQKLLTHKNSLMTQRYAHLRDETLKKASNLAGSIIEQATNSPNKDKVVSLEDK